MDYPKTVSIQLPSLSDIEVRHLLDALHDLTAIVEHYYRVPIRRRPSHPASAVEPPADTDTIDLFDNELPF